MPSLDPKIPPYRLVGDLTGTLSVAGSETMKPLTESWSAKLRQLYPGLSIKVESRGSETGLAALLEGKVQIAAMSRRMTQQEVVEFKREFGYEPTEVPVAVDALAVFVHKDNPIEGLTLAELDAVFSKERRRGLQYPVNLWGEVMVLEEEWAEGYGEIIGGSQRTASYELLVKRIKEHDLPEEAFKWYLDLRKYGSVPHSGFGMGIERAVAWICGLEHVRETIPFPRMLYRLYP